jgi:hypothetical protein
VVKDCHPGLPGVRMRTLPSAGPAGIDVERQALILFDLLLVVVLGLLLYSISARDPLAPPGLFDKLQLALVVSALAIDVQVGSRDVACPPGSRHRPTQPRISAWAYRAAIRSASTCLVEVAFSGQQVGVGGTTDGMRRLRKVGVTAPHCGYVARHE